MKGLFLALVVVVVLGAAFLALMPWSSPALAAGPDAGTGAWGNTEFPCTLRNGSVGRALINTKSGDPHCWRP